MEHSVARQHQERSDRRTCPSVAEDLPDRDSGMMWQRCWWFASGGVSRRSTVLS